MGRLRVRVSARPLRVLLTSEPLGGASDRGPSQPVVAAVVATYNGAAWIGECLGSLVHGSYPVQVIVVDNGSTDGTLEMVGGFPSVVCLPQTANLGFGRANNLGIRRALADGAELVLLLNQDARVEADCLAELVRASLAHPECGVLSPLHLNDEASAFDPTFASCLGLGAPDFAWDAYTGQTRPLYPIRFVNAAAWLITAQCLATVGGFDPLFFVGGEDNDYCHRVRHHGLQVGVVPAAAARHSRGQVTKSSLRARTEDVIGEMRNNLKRLTYPLLVELLRVLTNAAANAAFLAFRRDGEGLAALALALARVTLSLPRVIRHRRICRRAGAHWL